MYDDVFMQRAIALSRQSLDVPGTQPFGAVIVRDGTIVGEGFNHAVARFDPTSHGEVVHLTMDPPVNSCRPSADPVFSSLSHVYGSGRLAVVLTGIGQDGMVGAKAISQAGGSIIAQDKDSCVVYGMPKAVAEIGICQAILPLNSIAAYLKRRCS